MGDVPTSVPDSLPPEDERDLITAIISCLNHRLALNLCANPLLFRDHISRNISKESPNHMLLVGASHARHMASYFDMLDISVSCVSVPGWRATACKAEQMAKLVEEAIAELPPDRLKKTVAVFQLLDNTAYMVKTEEGGLMPCRKEANTNQYHVEGEVMLAPKELLKTILNTCTPVFRAAGDIAKIVMVPLPRYTHNGCCEDKDHATNCANPDYITQLLANLDGMRRQIKDLCFSANLRNISVINLSRTVEECQESWGSDPVHLKGEGYSIITNNLIQEAKRLLSTNKQVCRSNPSAAERNRKRDNSLSSGGVSKKPLCVTHTGSTTTRQPEARVEASTGDDRASRGTTTEATGTLPAQGDTTTEVAVAVEAGEEATFTNPAGPSTIVYICSFFCNM